MDWFKTTSAFWSHPKIADLKDRPFRVLVSSWGYAAQHGTNGTITKTALRMIGGTPAVAKALVDAGLWTADGDAWRIHQWDEHQAAAVAHEDRKARDRARKAEARSARTVHGMSEEVSADIPWEESAESPPTEKKRGEKTYNNPLRTISFRQHARAQNGEGIPA